jgi:hypothetical protein
MQRPRIFIGSSTEGRHYADAVFAELEPVGEPTVWDRNVFRPSRTTIEALDKAVHHFNFAVFILTPDDLRTSRGVRSLVPRDNLIFELGLFTGALGRDRVWFLVPGEDAVGIPSDLLGVIQLHYKHRTDGDYRSAVLTACGELRRLIATTDKAHTSATQAVLYWHTIPDRQRDGVDARSLIGRSVRRVFISGITLFYLARYCRTELKDAAGRGVQTELVIAENSPESVARYARYSPEIKDNLPAAHRRYHALAKKFQSEGLPPLTVWCTSIPLTHSIGLYDDAIYVSEFCIDAESPRAPSFCVPAGTPSYRVFIAEIRVLLRESVPLIGSKRSAILKSL